MTRMGEEITSDEIFDKIHSLYEFFDDTSKYIKDYCNKYETS